MEFKGLKTIMINNFHLPVKYVSEDEFSEENFKINLSNIQWVETHAMEHTDVINMSMENNTVIPFKFGTIFRSEDSLKKFVTDHSITFNENFTQIKEKEEWTVKIYCNIKTLSEQIDELSEPCAALEKKIMASSPGKAYLLERKKIILIENEVERLCKNFGQTYYDEFKLVSEETCLNNLLPKEHTGKTETMILNATFLVWKNKVKDFKNTSDTMVEKARNHGFSIETTGPWPLFSFVTINEQL
jgi:hypothetical protein